MSHLFDEFTPLAGDRLFGEDQAVIAGLARFRGRAVAVVGQEKGNDTKSRIKHNFGAAMPEGYRKAQRLFDMADRFGLPVISLVDTSGAYPGVAAEERGQSEAIARSTQAGLELRVPFICTIIGDGMSGGALAIATANRVYMLEHSIYSVISPEGCASILWRNSDKAQEAATALRITGRTCSTSRSSTRSSRSPSAALTARRRKPSSTSASRSPRRSPSSRPSRATSCAASAARSSSRWGATSSEPKRQGVSTKTVPPECFVPPKAVVPNRCPAASGVSGDSGSMPSEHLASVQKVCRTV